MNNYGCSGENYLDLSSPVLGLPVDEVDNAICAWKLCIWGAQTHANLDAGRTNTTVPHYNFDLRQNTCMNQNTTLEWSICECDFEFAVKLQDQTEDFNHQEYDQSQCSFPEKVEKKSALFHQSFSLL